MLEEAQPDPALSPRVPGDETARPTESESSGSIGKDVLEPLPPATRIALWVIGSILLFLGLVGLALPVVPQAVPLALGAALLSLASERFYSLLAKNVERWPRLARRLARLRSRLHRWVS